jgi:hypothetical protein
MNQERIKRKCPARGSFRRRLSDMTVSALTAGLALWLVLGCSGSMSSRRSVTRRAHPLQSIGVHVQNILDLNGDAAGGSMGVSGYSLVQRGDY